MNAIFNGKMKYLFLVPIALLVIFAILNLSSITKLNKELLDDKKNSLQAEVDHLIYMVDKSGQQGKIWSIDDIVNILGAVIANINDKNSLYAAIYDQDLNLLVNSYVDPRFQASDPTQFYEFKYTVTSNQSGWTNLPDAKSNSQEGGSSVYYKWTADQRYLVALSVSADSLTINPAGWLTTSMIIELSVTFIMNTAFVVLLCYLGYIFNSRKGEKWRQPN